MLEEILGTTNTSKFFAWVVFAFIGVIISLLVHATNRDKNSMRTPYKFNPGFLIDDNLQRILLNLILILVTIRFCKEVTGLELNNFISMCIGISYDKLGEFLRNKNVIDKDQQK